MLGGFASGLFGLCVGLKIQHAYGYGPKELAQKEVDLEYVKLEMEFADWLAKSEANSKPSKADFAAPLNRIDTST